MQTLSSLFSSKSGILSILSGIVVVLTFAVPVLPNPWGGLVAAILAVLAYYHIGTAVTAGRVQGIKGL
jgi:hypothetical protein